MHLSAACSLRLWSIHHLPSCLLPSLSSHRRCLNLRSCLQGMEQVLLRLHHSPGQAANLEMEFEKPALAPGL